MIDVLNSTSTYRLWSTLHALVCPPTVHKDTKGVRAKGGVIDDICNVVLNKINTL